MWSGFTVRKHIFDPLSHPRQLHEPVEAEAEAAQIEYGAYVEVEGVKDVAEAGYQDAQQDIAPAYRRQSIGMLAAGAGTYGCRTLCQLLEISLLYYRTHDSLRRTAYWPCRDCI